MGTARTAALTALQKWRTNAAWSDAALHAAIEREQLPPRDAALASRLCYGTLQNLLLIDAYLAAFCAKPLRTLQPQVLDILRIGVCQLKMMDSIPAHAAVSEAVALCKVYGCAKASGLVNAVLRRVAEMEDALPPLPAEETQWLSVRYSHPNWLTEMLLQEHDRDFVEAFYRANNDIPPICLQVNTLRTTAAELLAVLTAEGYAAQVHPSFPDMLLCAGGDIAKSSAFSRGLFYVQDPAAHLAVSLADPRPGMTVLDACAAPGGKSFAAAIRMRDQGRIRSCDLHENKLRRIRATADRLGLTIIETAACDARAQQGRYDVVLADVPCSGLGVIRKKPEIRYKDPAQMEGLPAIQREILEALSACVKPGGVLCYSTCTILRRENEGVIEPFLAAHPDLTVEAMRTLWPQTDGTDGFFICTMRKHA